MLLCMAGHGTAPHPHRTSRPPRQSDATLGTRPSRAVPTVPWPVTRVPFQDPHLQGPEALKRQLLDSRLSTGHSG